MVPLRPLPANAPRPQPLSDEVIARALLPVKDALGSWFQAHYPEVTPEYRDFSLSVAMRRGEMQAYGAALVLSVSFNYLIDDDLIRILLQVSTDIDYALRMATQEWVLQTGHRFPGSDGDSIEWMDPVHQMKRGGKVIAVNRGMAYAVVQPGMGGDKQTIQVMAEHVVGNLTTKQYTEIKPILGQHYEDAPALAAAFEAERVKDAKLDAVFETSVRPRVDRDIGCLPDWSPKVAERVPPASEVDTPCPRCDGRVAQVFNGAFCSLCDGFGYLPDALGNRPD